MSKSILALSVAASFFSVSAVAVDYKHYNGSPDRSKETTLPSGAIGNADSLTQLMKVTRISKGYVAEKITVKGDRDVWMIGGALYAPVVIKGNTGLIVISTGEHNADGANFRQIIREQIGNDPIVAIIYDHSHYAYGAEALLDGDKAIIVGHRDANAIEDSKEPGTWAVSQVPEMGPHLNAKAFIHMGLYTPKEGIDAQLLPAFNPSEDAVFGRLPVTHPVDHDDKLVIDGIEFIFKLAETDTRDTITIYSPEMDLIVDNVLWSAINAYTLRGDTHRSPTVWIEALDDLRSFNAATVLSVGSGSNPVYGKENVRNQVNAVRDQMAFIYDQSIRLTNQGVAPDQLKHHITMPKSLASLPYINESYGQWEHFPEANANFNQGWFSGRAEDLHTLPSAVEARNMIKLAGGVENVFNAYQSAMKKEEYIWAKDLATMLYNDKPQDKKVRQALADVFRELGKLSPGLIARNFYISAALNLEEKNEASLVSVESEQWVKTDLARAVKFLRVRINPEKAEGVVGALTFNIDGKIVSLAIRNSVAEFVDGGIESAHSINVSVNDFVAYYRGEKTASSIASDKALELLALFDEYKYISMY